MHDHRASVVIILFLFAFVSTKVFEMEQSEKQNELIQQVMRQMLAGQREQTGKAGLVGFSWKDCKGQYVSIKSLSLAPSKLKFPGSITLSADVNITSTIKEPLEVSLDVSKEVFGTYIHIPCIDNVGSCTYTQLCDKLAQLKQNCPAQLVSIGIDCSCPINKKMYSIQQATFDVPNEDVPSGKYRVTAKLLQNNVQAACVEVNFEIA